MRWNLRKTDSLTPIQAFEWQRTLEFLLPLTSRWLLCSFSHFQALDYFNLFLPWPAADNSGCFSLDPQPTIWLIFLFDHLFWPFISFSRWTISLLLCSSNPLISSWIFCSFFTCQQLIIRLIFSLGRGGLYFSFAPWPRADFFALFSVNSQLTTSFLIFSSFGSLRCFLSYQTSSLL